MADYKIDVRAALDVKGYKKQLDEITLGRIIKVTLNPTVDFKEELNSKTLGELTGLKNRIQDWFNKSENQIAINIAYQPNAQLKQQLESIRSAIKTVAPINVPVNTDTKKINSLATALTKIGDAYKNIDNYKSIYISVDSNVEESQQKLSSLKQQINIVKETSKNFEPVLVNIGFKTEDLAKLYKDITDIQDKLKSLENIEIKTPNNLVNNIKNSLQDIKMGIEFDEEKKKNFEESISNLNLLLNSLRKIEIEIDLNQEQKEKLNNTITEIDNLLNSLRIIEIGINFNEQQKKEFEDSINSLKDNSNIEINVKFNETQKDKLTQDVTNATQSLSSLKNIEIGINESQKSQIKKDIEDIETSLNSLKNIPINIGISDAQKNQLIQSIDNIVNSLNEIAKNVKIGIAFDENSKEQLSKEIASIALLLHTLQEVEIKASFTQESKEQLSKEISTIALLLNALQKVEIHIGFAQDSKEQLNKEIASTALLLNALRNVEINIKFNQEQKQKLGEDIANIALLLKTLQDGIEIKISNPSNENLQDIKKYIDDYFSNNPVNLNFQANINGQNGAQNVQNTFNQLNQHVENTVGQMNNAVNQLNQNIQNNVRDTTNNITNNTLRVGDTIRNTLDQSQRQYNTLDQSVRVRFNETNRLVINNIQRTYNTARDAVNNTRGLFDDLMRYFGVQRIFSAVQNSFQQMVQEVRDLDVELTEFSKVTDLTTEETEKFIDKAYELGDAVARTGTEVVQATTLFKKMGYELQESMGFAEDALMWTNVADGLVTVESAATMLISTMKAFEEQGISSTHVIDALNEVSNNYSTSSSALSDNLSAVSATLAVSGTSFEQTIGLMTAGIEIMPDKASKVANGLKTISQRIRQIDGATADKLDEFFDSKGISRFDKLTGELKGTYDILEEVSKIWDTLTINERQYIGEVMAGKNQITVLNALMMNFATAINATETAMNSAGSAARENERVLDSIQGHIQKFQSAFEELSKNLINSEVFKQVVDFGTNILKLLTDLTDKTWKLIGIFSGAGIATIIDAIQRFNNGFQQAQNTVRQFNDALEEAHQRGLRLDQTFREAPTREEYFASLINGFTAVTAAIGTVVTAITVYKQAWENAQEEQRKRQQEIINDKNQEIDKIKQLKKLEEEYLETTDVEKKKLLYEKIHDIRVEIANLDTDGLSRQELLSGAIGKQNGLYDDQLVKISKNNLALIRQQQILEETSKGFWGDAPIIKWFTGNLPTFRKDNVPVELDLFNEDYFNNQNYGDYLNNQEISIQNKIDNLKALEDHFKGMMDTFDPGTKYYEMYRRLYDYVLVDLKQLQKENETVMVESQDIAETVLGDLSTYTEDELESMSQLFDALSTGNVEDINKALEELRDVFGEDLEDNFLQEIKENLSDPNVAQAAYDLIDTFLTLREEGKKTSSEIEYSYSSAMGGLLSILTETTTSIQEQYDTLAQAVDEFNQSGVITKETLQSLTENDLLQYLEIVNGELVLNEEAFYRAADSALAKASADIDEKVNAEIAAMANDMLKKSLDDVADATTGASQGIDNAAEASSDSVPDFMNAGSSAEIAALAVKYLKSEGENVEIDTSGIEKFQQEAQKLIDSANELKNKLGGFTPSANRGSSSSSSSSSSRSSSSSSDREEQQAQREAERAQREAEQRAKEAQQAWKKSFETEYKKLKTLLDSGVIDYEQYYNALEFLNEKFFKDRTEFEEEYWKYQDEILKGRKKYLEDELENYFEKGEKLLQHQLNMEQITEEEYYEALTKLYESYYTDKEKYEEEYWKLQEQIYNFRKKQVQELENQLDDIYKEIEDLHEEYIESLEEDAEQIETTIGYAIDVIDEEISKLQEEKDAINEANEALQEQIKLQELQDALEKAKQKKTRVYRKGQGFVYEQDIQAISEAQTALDEYKNELQHKKRLAMIDEEISKLESYKQEWKNITEQYKKAQERMTAESILGGNARERILNREYNAVGLVGLKYEETQKKIKEANEATIEDLEKYIGDENKAKTLSYEIKKIKDKIDEIKGKTVEVKVQTGTSETDINKIISSIDTLKEKLESEYSTQTLDDWLEKWKKTIRDAYNEINDPTVNPPNPDNPDNPNPNPNPSGLTIGDRVNFTEAGIQEAVAQSNGLSEAYVRQLIEGWGDWEIKGIGLDGKFRVGPVNSPDVTWAISANGLIRAGETPSNPPENPPEDEQPQIQPGTNRGDEDWSDTNHPMYWTGVEWLPLEYQGVGDDRWWYNPITNEIHEVTDRDLNEFASGTLGTDSRIFKINENGIEAMVTPDGTVISAPTPGYGVIKNEYTKRLTDFASDPLSFLSKEFSGYRGNYQNNQSKNEVININGNLTLPNVTDGESFINSIKTLALQYTTRR